MSTNNVCRVISSLCKQHIRFSSKVTVGCKAPIGFHHIRSQLFISPQAVSKLSPCTVILSQYCNGIKSYTKLFSTLPKKEPENKPSLYQRFKLMYKEYWYVLVPVHVVTSAVWFGGFYYLAVTGVDIAKLLELIGSPDSWVTTMGESKAGGIVTAYTLYKIATPARYTVTLGGTTISINYLKKWGWIKPMPSSDELRTMYEDKKTLFKDRIQVTKDEIKDEFKKTAEEITKNVKEARSELKDSVKETREDFKQGVREAAEEWKHVGKLVKQRTGELLTKSLQDEKNK